MNTAVRRRLCFAQVWRLASTFDVAGRYAEQRMRNALRKPSGLMRSVEKMMQAFGCIPYGMHPAEPSCILPSDSFLTE